MSLHVKDSKGNWGYITVSGQYDDDIQIDEAYYEDESLGDIPDDEVDYIYETYADEIYEEWQERQIARADALYDSWKDGD